MAGAVRHSVAGSWGSVIQGPKGAPPHQPWGASSVFGEAAEQRVLKGQLLPAPQHPEGTSERKGSPAIPTRPRADRLPGEEHGGLSGLAAREHARPAAPGGLPRSTPTSAAALALATAARASGGALPAASSGAGPSPLRGPQREQEGEPRRCAPSVARLREVGGSVA